MLVMVLFGTCESFDRFREHVSEQQLFPAVQTAPHMPKHESKYNLDDIQCSCIQGTVENGAAILK